MKNSNFYTIFLLKGRNFYYRLFMILMLVAAVQNKIDAQNFRLVKDINTSTDGNPQNFKSSSTGSSAVGYAVLNGISYFAADDGVNGRGLWRSDGTGAGTYQLKSGINPSNIIASTGKIYFSGNSSPIGLWKSDGTVVGTVPVLEVVPPGLGKFLPTGLTDLDGTVYFAVTGRSVDDQLWKTDGTAAGTILVKDLYDQAAPANGSTGIAEMTAIKNKLYFTAYAYGVSDRVARLWVSDATGAGTFKLSNTIMALGIKFVARSLDIADPFVYFSSWNQNYQPTLYITNGQPGGIGTPAGFNALLSYQYGGTEKLINMAGSVYFIGRPDNNDYSESLYKYDAASGIRPVKTFAGANADGNYSRVSNVAEVNGTLYYSVYDATINKNQVWKSDGSSLGNILLKDGVSASNITSNAGAIYFTGSNSLRGAELWKTDGTVNGTVLVKDINTGTNSSTPASLTNVNNNVFFTATDSTHGFELWQSDGNAAGTALVKDINQSTSNTSYPNNLKAFNNKVIFNTQTNAKGNIYSNFWKSDGTSAGTNAVNETIQGFDKQTSAVLNNEVYFRGNSSSGKKGLYKTDGTPAGTVLVKDFTGTPFYFYGIVATNNLVYFYGRNNSSASYELWRTDGTVANTYVIKNDFTNLESNSKVIIASGNTLFFAPYNTKSLWKSDGTIAGTTQLQSFAADPYNFAAADNDIYFRAFDGTSNTLWKSDATAAGTRKITGNVVDPDNLIFCNGSLFFTGIGNVGVYGNIGAELFKTDGTSPGTVLVKDINPGVNSSSFYGTKISIGDKIYFTNYGASGIELWKSDGTTAGTKLIINLGNVQLAYNEFTGCNGKLFFVINDYVNQKNILWESDGTTAGTHPTADNIFSDIKIDYSPELTSSGNQLFFRAGNYQTGQELYVGGITAPPGNDSFSLCPNGSAGITSSIYGNTYQWQINTGSGFAAIAENSVFSGVSSNTLQVKNIPASYSGAQFRCLVNGSLFSKITTLTFEINWTGNINNNWENTGNWGCGGQLPDGNTDVVITHGQVIINSNATCKSIDVKPGASVLVNTGYILTVTGK